MSALPLTATKLVRRNELTRCAQSRPNAPQQKHRYSITSSARAISIGETSRPSALAVLRLIGSSKLVGACTGRSAGFSPSVSELGVLLTDLWPWVRKRPNAPKGNDDMT